MQVHGAAAGVAAITGIPDDVTSLHAIAWTKIAVTIQMRVVVPLESGAEDPDHLASEPIVTDAYDQAGRRTHHGRVLWREDVDALMPATARTRIPPGVNEPRRPPWNQRIGQQDGGLLRCEREDELGSLDKRLGHGSACRHEERGNQYACESFHGFFSLPLPTGPGELNSDLEAIS